MEELITPLVVTTLFTVAMVLLVFIFMRSVDRRDIRYTMAITSVASVVEKNTEALEKFKAALDLLVKEVASKKS
jgi:hypothetical protein